MKGLSSAQVAAREAREEAGLVGRVSPGCIGSFEFERLLRDSGEAWLIDVYPLFVERQVRNWDEKSQHTVLRCDITSGVSLV